MKLTIVIPCHNEVEAVPLIYKETSGVLSTMDIELQSEFLFVDDGSCDKTLDVLVDMSQKNDDVKYISFSRNFGKEAAIYAGISNATGELVAVMDADMQDPPSLLPKMIEAVAGSSQGKQYDIARTRRVNRKGEPKIRSFCARQFYKIINRFSVTEIADGARDYLVMNRKAANAIISMREYNRFFKGMSSWIGFDVTWFEYENVERAVGETKWNFWSLFRYALDGIVAFSTTPLVIAAGIGLVCFFISLIMIVFIIMRVLLFGDPVSGWPSTVCIILCIGGLQLLCMGVLGQYLAKTYLETKRRPLYIIDTSNINKLNIN